MAQPKWMASNVECKQHSKRVPEIKKFGGNALEFRRFLRQFQAKVVANTDDDEEKMNYLEQLTHGEAHKVVSGFSHVTGEKAYKAAMAQLEERYGDNNVIATAFIKKALDWPMVRAGDAEALDEFSLFLVECENAVGSIGAGSVREYSENVKRLMGKLPFHLHDRWRSIVLRTKEAHRTVKFADLVRLVKAEAKKANDPTYGNTAVGMHMSKDQSLNGRTTIRMNNSVLNAICEVSEKAKGSH
ncbi:PREDICTED: uncharacterized protein LOC106808795 [Priapulus caudatus]|uniref:Uncharacterized protein LOC106808795 n=1 Tax=Priapulus caudatus TaxID=37621 RepID=A0ABM1E4L3_PRICU|nr:PREDICTED: uncharacterized protein LOC106808795 [Priapulus caudatus]